MGRWCPALQEKTTKGQKQLKLDTFSTTLPHLRGGLCPSPCTPGEEAGGWEWGQTSFLTKLRLRIQLYCWACDLLLEPWCSDKRSGTNCLLQP